MMKLLALECYDESLDKWCRFELIDAMCGSIETMAKIQDVSQIPERPYGRYLYDNDEKSNVWFYATPPREHVRIKGDN